ncbi:hypothetical protein ABEB36_010301 [Hypothenemus hampei]|uniref:PX domain-containing protein n=1 Tax=Hypothenemus hampei TaxID=57062 RepID=A0ABD1ELA6_HYPHA
MSTGTVPLISKSDPEHTNILLKQLLDCIQRCQRRYGGKNVLATEFDSCVAGLCLCLEGVFLHGLRTKPIQNPLKQVSEIVAQSLNIRQETIYDKSRGTMDFQKSEILREKGELEANGIKQNQEWDAISDNKSDESGQSDIAITLMENSGSRQTFQSNMPGTLTPVNQNTIGELTPVSVENFNESVEISDDILEVPTDISAVLTVVEHKNQEELRRRDERITLLSKENQALKEQVSKYVSAIKMLKRDDHDLIDGLEGLDIETQPDYKGEARMFEQKLIQVAEMHAELMDFNVMLQKSLQQKDTLLDRLKEELEVLKGPIALQELESEGNRGCINIWIPSAFLTGTGSSAHHVYQLFLRVGNDEWNIYRRYAQFYALHTDLKKLDPAVNSFDFPPKKSIGKKDSALVEERRKRLQSYLRKVIAHWPELANCNNRFLLEQHLAFFKDQQEDEAKRNMFSSRKSGNPGNSSGL